ncbi:hypothetical protein DUNSADRAFT_15011 [Dunaliella salina]|uniref:Encoded protein n=1 Tax=Dunaliella salina TaxID=3046 RepID=A0ABQ7G683_DUNSA|nr:hypothetical protein DUNSADRAFT_15011 [Dunaliella salina]|eukprot:KAF5830120.1 hypothetical protein DUNSADRAFT_15011 [Dunaliella salina]
MQQKQQHDATIMQQGQGKARRRGSKVQAAANHAKQSGSRPGPLLDQAVIFIPRRTPACERVLEEEGVSGDVRCGELGLDMVPIEDDVLSLELDHAFKECVVDGDSGPLYAAARAILRLQAMFGLIPRVQVCCPIWLANCLVCCLFGLIP